MPEYSEIDRTKETQIQNNEKDGNGNHSSELPKSLLTRLGLALQRRRVSLGLSQWQLSERASVNRTYLSDIERGVCNATIAMLARICTGLDTKLWVVLRDLDT